VEAYGFALAKNNEGHGARRRRRGSVRTPRGRLPSSAHGTNYDRFVARLARDFAKAVGVAWLPNLDSRLSRGSLRYSQCRSAYTTSRSLFSFSQRDVPSCGRPRRVLHFRVSRP
jgi:hypothetical protein